MWYWSGTVGMKQNMLCSSLWILNYVNADSRGDFQLQFFQVCLMFLLTKTDLGGRIHLGSFSSPLSRGPVWTPSHFQSGDERSQSTASLNPDCVEEEFWTASWREGEAWRLCGHQTRCISLQTVSSQDLAQMTRDRARVMGKTTADLFVVQDHEGESNFKPEWCKTRR